jgi:hypothetical protein
MWYGFLVQQDQYWLREYTLIFVLIVSLERIFRFLAIFLYNGRDALLFADVRVRVWDKDVLVNKYF